MIKEFYSNLVFNDNVLHASSLLKGRKIELTQEFLGDVLGYPNEGIERYYNHKEVPYEGYSCDCIVKELMDEKGDSMDVSRLIAYNRVLLSDISQMVIPRIGKSNIPTFLEIFYSWCALQPVNLSFIILSHMKNVLGNKKAELPYGMVLMVIAKRRNVNLNIYTAKMSSLQGTYGSILLQNISFCLSGKGWTRDEDHVSNEEPSAKKGKHKVGSTSKHNPPP